MLKLLNKLCGDGLSCPFQKALRNCTYSDWTIPPQNDLQYVISCLKGGQASTIRVQKAFTIFRLKFQNNQEKNNSPFLIKNVYILDKCSEQRVLLDLIAHYQNNRLFYDKSINPQNSSQGIFFFIKVQVLRQFVASYFLYVKKKALIYQKMKEQIFFNKTRAAYIKTITKSVQLFQLIDNCFQIQKLINETSEKVKKCNKSALLIQNILIGILKVYIFCYCVVSLSIQALLGKIQFLNKPQLNNFLKLIKYYNKEYTNSFLTFLQSNKSIELFRTFQYSDLVKIDQTYVKIVQNIIKIKNIQNSKIACKSSYEDCLSPKKQGNEGNDTNDTADVGSIVQDSQFLNILELPQQLVSSLKFQIKFSYKQRKMVQLVASSDAHQYEKAFENYSNYYSQDMIQEQKRINEGGSANLNSSLKLQKKTSGKILKKKSLMEDLVNLKFKKSQSMREKQAQSSKKFNMQIWDKWQNIYAF